MLNMNMNMNKTCLKVCELLVIFCDHELTQS